MASSSSKTKDIKVKRFHRFKKPPKLTTQSEEELLADFDDSVSILSYLFLKSVSYFNIC